MKSLNRCAFVLVIVLQGSCGTSGHLQFYSFIVSKSDAKKELLRVVNTNGYSAPANWNGYEQGKGKEDIFIYFKDEPQELYSLAFNDYGESPEQYRDLVVLALVGVFDGKCWLFERDLNRTEEERVKERLEKEILDRMKYTYTKE